jgi:hypothetical protein
MKEFKPQKNLKKFHILKNVFCIKKFETQKILNNFLHQFDIWLYQNRRTVAVSAQMEKHVCFCIKNFNRKKTQKIF